MTLIKFFYYNKLLFNINIKTRRTVFMTERYLKKRYFNFII